ncbi:2-oxoglutarate and iron-dependent oxygenase domain-containing protein 2 [Holothuria leucospilota]|uniref:2-oxoglutarate and iron-dependent oxygenase domain-containing protein 2 n=1 Tax=Holothuria leucospilota TaxID=206669 RepID=A0A9Q1CDD8_HOLLE|nr:2-oxoglutarate and iron-dependent oxygenase domain-containing protein 2 [Holothuria leucospilota]
MNWKSKEFFVCGCFFTHNYFLKDYKCHVTYYDDDDKFSQDWKSVLQSKGCKTKEQFEDVLHKVRTELRRRKNLGPDSMKRRKEVLSRYKPLHPHLYTLQDSYLSSEFKELVLYACSKDATVDGLVKRIALETAEKVYSFPVFSEVFCREFIEELCHFEQSDLPKGRPNTMNNYGILLNELGFDEGFLTPLREQYLTPLARLLFPEQGGGNLDSHKAFVVTYKMDEDLDLNYHYDNSEVTINVSLGKEFCDGVLYFGDMRTAPRREEYTRYVHKPTIGLLHRGQHMHGAMPISDGERYNLIIWMRSSQVRNKLCPMCDEEPKLVRTEGYGDGFSQLEPETVNVCSTL